MTKLYSYISGFKVLLNSYLVYDSLWLQKLYVYFNNTLLQLIVFIFGVVASLGVCFYILPAMGLLAGCVSRLNHAGLYLEVLGIVITLFQIRSARRLFNLPNTLGWFKSLIKVPLPFRKPSQTISGSFSGSSSVSAVLGSGIVMTRNSLEERLAYLENQFSNHLHSFKEFQNEASSKFNDVDNKLRVEVSNLVQSDTNLADQLKELSVGGSGWQIVGIAWVIVGLVFSTATNELLPYTEKLTPSFSFYKECNY